MTPGLIKILEDVRENFGLVNVTSGRRCVTHNAAVDGRPGSYHLRADAADISVPGASPAMIYYYLSRHASAAKLGLGLYHNFTHIDVRGYPARWDG